MILHSQSLSEFVSIRANSWLIHSQWPETPNRPIQPSLPGNYDVIMQNKPNPQNTKTNATSFTAKDYKDTPPHPKRKNKPNQTQFRPKQTRRRAEVGRIPRQTTPPQADFNTPSFLPVSWGGGLRVLGGEKWPVSCL